MKIFVMTVLFLVAFGTGGMIAEVTHQPTEKVVTRVETVHETESLNACMDAYWKGAQTIDIQIDIINSLIDIIWGDKVNLNGVRLTPKPDHLSKIYSADPTPAMLKI